jgi:hypothetical protein
LSIDLAYNGFGDTAVITKTLNAGNLNAGNLNADDCVIKEIRAADFDGDGCADIAIYIPGSGALTVRVFFAKSGFANYRTITIPITS